jgi:hypothetical protein
MSNDDHTESQSLLEFWLKHRPILNRVASFAITGKVYARTLSSDIQTIQKTLRNIDKLPEKLKENLGYVS